MLGGSVNWQSPSVDLGTLPDILNRHTHLPAVSITPCVEMDSGHQECSVRTFTEALFRKVNILGGKLNIHEHRIR